MRTLCYLIGVPGAGKSTAMAALLDRWELIEEIKLPFAHRRLRHPDLGEAAELGRHRPGGFSGTDALAMAVQPRVLQWLYPGHPDRSCPFDLVLGEGDRLGNSSFLEGAMARGWTIRLAILTISPLLAQARRDARGSEQHEPWVRGRQTKVYNMARWAADRPVRISTAMIDASRPVDAVARDLHAHFFGNTLDHQKLRAPIVDVQLPRRRVVLGDQETP